MKKILAIILALAMLLALVACTKTDDENNTPDDDEQIVDGDNTEEGGDDEGDETPDAEGVVFDYMKEDLTKYLTLGEYKGLKASRGDPNLTDEEFREYVNGLLANYPGYEHIIDREIVEGDKVIIDYAGEREGTDFGNATATNVEVIAADGNGFIPGFGSSLIGHKPGDAYAADITFPEDYQNDPELAGVQVTFHFLVKYIAGDDIVFTVDTIDDAFAQTSLGFETAEEFLEAQHAGLVIEKEYSTLENEYNELWRQVIDNSELIAYPDGVVEEEYNYFREAYEYYASYYGTDYNTFLSDYVGITDEQLLENCRNSVKENLVMYSLIKELDAEVTDAEVKGKTAFYAEMYGATEEQIINSFGEDAMRSYAQFDKVLAIVAGFGEITEYTPAE